MEYTPPVLWIPPPPAILNHGISYCCADAVNAMQTSTAATMGKRAGILRLCLRVFMVYLCLFRNQIFVAAFGQRERGHLEGLGGFSETGYNRKPPGVSIRVPTSPAPR